MLPSPSALPLDLPLPSLSRPSPLIRFWCDKLETTSCVTQLLAIRFRGMLSINTVIVLLTLTSALQEVFIMLLSSVSSACHCHVLFRHFTDMFSRVPASGARAPPARGPPRLGRGRSASRACESQMSNLPPLIKITTPPQQNKHKQTTIWATNQILLSIKMEAQCPPS